MSSNTFPLLETVRLNLRKILESDADIIFFLRNDAKVNEFIYRSAIRKTKTKEDALLFIEKITKEFENNKESITWGITEKNNPQIIGTICLWNFSIDRKTAEVGYALKPEFQKKGIMSEVLKKVLEYGFQELNLKQIEAFTQADNTNSIKLLLKLGFKQNVKRIDLENKKNLVFEIDN